MTITAGIFKLWGTNYYRFNEIRLGLHFTTDWKQRHDRIDQ